MSYHEQIHIWEFPPTLTFIRLEENFRSELFRRLLSKFSSQQKLLDIINRTSEKYNIKRKHSRGNLYCWIKGNNIDRGRRKTINIPLWVLIEFSKIISNSILPDNEIMKNIEKNIEYYTGWGKANPVIQPKLPLLLTPELVSVIFHFLGDGHIGSHGVSSSYRQMNDKGLRNFLDKLQNCFGNFEYSKQEFADGRLNVPKVITDFYVYYFNLPDTSTFKGYVTDQLKKFDKDFLVASLTSFIIDEGNINDCITVYSKNLRLIEDIREIGLLCGYLCHQVKKKYAYGRFDVYRFNISSKSFVDFFRDIEELSKEFPTCNLAHKQTRFANRIHKSSSVYANCRKACSFS